MTTCVLVEQVALVCLSTDLTPTVQHLSPESGELLTPRLPEFCFSELNSNSDPSRLFLPQPYTFVLTKMSGERYYAFCKRAWELGDDLPVCLCLISQLPWHSVFDVLLRVAEDIYLEEGTNGLIGLHQKLSEPFELPRAGQLLPLTGFQHLLAPNYNAQEMPMGKPKMENLLAALSPENILTLFSALCSESRILMYSSDVVLLSHSVLSAVSLLYPFSWQHILVPLLPASMLSYCSAPMPFIIGFHSSLLNDVMQLPLEEILFIDLDKDTLYFSQPKNFASVPDHEVSELKRALITAHNPSLNSETSYSLVQHAFYQLFQNALKSFLWFYQKDGAGKAPGTDSAVRYEYDRELFAKVQRDPSLRKFLAIFTQTQAFTQFIEERRSFFEVNKPLPDTFLDHAALHDLQNGERPNFDADYSNQSKIDSYIFTFSKKIKGKIDVLGKKLSSPETNTSPTGTHSPSTQRDTKPTESFEVYDDHYSYHDSTSDTHHSSDDAKLPNIERTPEKESPNDIPQNPFAVVQPRAKVVVPNFFDEKNQSTPVNSAPATPNKPLAFPLSSQAQASRPLPPTPSTTPTHVAPVTPISGSNFVAIFNPSMPSKGSDSTSEFSETNTTNNNDNNNDNNDFVAAAHQPLLVPLHTPPPSPSPSPSSSQALLYTPQHYFPPSSTSSSPLVTNLFGSPTTLTTPKTPTASQLPSFAPQFPNRVNPMPTFSPVHHAQLPQQQQELPATPTKTPNYYYPSTPTTTPNFKASSPMHHTSSPMPPMHQASSPMHQTSSPIPPMPHTSSPMHSMPPMHPMPNFSPQPHYSHVVSRTVTTTTFTSPPTFTPHFTPHHVVQTPPTTPTRVTSRPPTTPTSTPTPTDTTGTTASNPFLCKSTKAQQSVVSNHAHDLFTSPSTPPAPKASTTNCSPLSHTTPVASLLVLPNQSIIGAGNSSYLSTHPPTSNISTSQDVLNSPWKPLVNTNSSSLL